MNFKNLIRPLFRSRKKTGTELLTLLKKKFGRVVFFRIDRLGDLLISSPFIRTFKKNHPGWTVYLVGSSINQEAAYKMEWVDKVFIYEKGNLLRTIWQIKGVKPDLSVDLNAAGSLSSGLISWFSEVPFRIGYKNPNSGFFQNLSIPVKDNLLMHQIDIQKALAIGMGMELTETDFDYRCPEGAHFFARSFLDSYFSPDHNLLISLHPGNIKKKEHRWPIHHFSELTCRILSEEKKVRILMIYGPGEENLMRTLTREIPTEFQSRILIPPPNLTLSQTAALIEKSDIFIDSGPTGTTHLATRLSTPQVIIYSGYSHQVWDTRRAKDISLVSPHWEDTQFVTVDEVFRGVMELVSRIN